MFNLQIIPVTPFRQNCTIIWDQNRDAAIIDPGGEAELLIQYIQENQLNLAKILLTHGHLDHISAAEQLKKHFNVAIYGAHLADKPLFDQLPEMCLQYGLTITPAFLPDVWLNDGDNISVGTLRFDVKHLPGHSPGHIGFFDNQNKIAFTGDVLFKDTVGRTDLFMGDSEQLLESIRSVLFPLPDDFIIMPGHGLHTTIAREKVLNPFLQV